MCWSASASVAMVALGGAAVAVTAMRGEPKAIWMTVGYFTVMEALQATGYAVVDECSNPANKSITLLSYLHIAFQPLVINAFAMAIAPEPVPERQRRWVYALAALATGFMLLKLVPLPALGACTPGSPLCGVQTCLISGDWHIGWTLPLNGLMEGLGAAFNIHLWFPAYNHAYARYGPGMLTTMKMLEAASAEGCQAFDFGPGEELYKTYFSDPARPVVEGRLIANPGRVSLSRALSETMGGRLRRRLHVVSACETSLAGWTRGLATVARAAARLKHRAALLLLAAPPALLDFAEVLPAV